MQNNKKAYQAPSLTVHGDASQLTQANSNGPQLDATFVAGTPINLVTGQVCTSA